MKTLIFLGSARKNGHTATIVEEFKKNLRGTIEIVDAYGEKNINPCIDCRFCWKKPECSIKDGMEKIYKKIEEADNIIFASPVYFHSISGKLKIIIDRFQVYWASRIRKDRKTIRKKAVLIMVGGAREFKSQFIGSEIVLEGTAIELGAEIIDKIKMSDSDNKKIFDYPEILDDIKKCSEKLNK